MIRLLTSLIFLGGLAFGGWWVWENYPPVRTFIEEKIDTREFSTLEARFTHDQLIENNRSLLMKGAGYAIMDPKLTYYPYAMMDVKYTTSSGSTKEGVVLWGLNDGEMVVDMSTWESTHGFEDCLLANANGNDFKILRTLVSGGGVMSREKLYAKFRVDNDILDDWVESCRRKKLVVVQGSRVRLHFENPKLISQPETRLNERLVAQPARHAQRAKNRYSSSQVKKLAEVAFGADFAVRKMSEVFLPVYTIAVQNPDGSILTTYWNALNGQRMEL